MAATTTALTVPLYNGYNMPILGLGTMLASKEEMEATLEAALEAGYRHIDTAFLYQNEAAIGEVLKKWFDSGKVRRDELFIVTKLPHIGIRAECVEKYLKKSLEALQLNYVDLYLVHSPVGYLEPEEGTPPGLRTADPTTDHLSVWKAMEAQVDAGRTRSIGLSNFNARQIKRIVKAARIPPANLQIELNVYFQNRELVAFCKALDITVCAYASLGSPGYHEFIRKMGRDLGGRPELKPMSDPVVMEVAKKHNKTPSQVLLRHVIQRGIITIPKSSNPNRIKENVQVFDFQLDEDDIDKLNALDKGSKARMLGGGISKEMSSHPEYPYHDDY